MRRLTALLVALWSSSALAVGDGNPNSWCPIGWWFWSKDTVPWRLSDDVEGDIATPGANDSPISLLDVRRDLDAALQQTSRLARHKVRSRITWADGVNCDQWSNIPCISSAGTEDSICNGTQIGAEGAIGGYANCDQFGSGRCWIVLCVNSIPIRSSTMAMGSVRGLFTHEIGHTLGLQHVNVDVGPNQQCGNDTEALTPDCGTTDGCDGELMCTQGGPSSCSLNSTVRQGDTVGMRTHFGGSSQYLTRKEYRVAWTNADAVGPSAVSQYSGYVGAFPQRLACASASAGVNHDCAAVRVITSSGNTSIRVMRLNAGATIGSAWSFATAASFDFPVFQAPDIAITPDGEYAFVALSRASGGGDVWVVRVDLDTGATQSVAVRTQGVTGDALQPDLPPRITWVKAWSRPVLWVAARSDGGLNAFPIDNPLATMTPGDNLRFGDTYPETPGSTDPGSLLGDSTTGLLEQTGLRAEFDVDCGRYTYVGGQYPWLTYYHDTCVVVAPRLSSLQSQGYDGQLQSRAIQFRYYPNPLFGAPNAKTIPAASWSTGATANLNGVLGVALSNTRILVAASTLVYTASQTTNTALLMHSGDSVSSLLDSELVKSDAETCGSATYWGYAVGGMTMHGGYPLAYCASCSWQGFEGSTFGARSSSDDFCW